MLDALALPYTRNGMPTASDVESRRLIGLALAPIRASRRPAASLVATSEVYRVGVTSAERVEAGGVATRHIHVYTVGVAETRYQAPDGVTGIYV